MDHQSGIKVFLNKLRLQIAALQRMFFPVKQPGKGQFKRAKQQEAVEQYPGLLLEIGNELLITDDIVKIYRGLSNALGRVVIIDQIATPADESIKASAFGIQVYVDLKNARHMRAAYLQREQAVP